MAVASSEIQQRLKFPPPPPPPPSLKSVRNHQKLKRVTWAPDGSLCQVRLFLSEDAPQQSGSLASQDILQAKTSWLWHSGDPMPEDTPPPGFAGTQPTLRLKKDLSKLQMIKWQLPPTFVINPSWQVVAGEESEETKMQDQRQLRVLEAIYPRFSSIPKNPAIAPEALETTDDLSTPSIPMNPVEEDDEATESTKAAATISSHKEPLCISHASPASMPLVSGLVSAQLPQTHQLNYHNQQMINVSNPSTSMVDTPEPDVGAAASAAFTAIIRSQQESLIDRDLLIQMLNNPALIEKLIAEHGLNDSKPLNRGATTNQLVVPSVSACGTSMAPSAEPIRPHFPSIRPDIKVSLPKQPGENFYPPNALQPMASPRLVGNAVASPTGMVSSSIPGVKDANYFKSLVKQHGEERPDAKELDVVRWQYHEMGIANYDTVHKPIGKDLRSKIQRPCTFYNTPRGCSRGSNCLYLHDDSARICAFYNTPKGCVRGASCSYIHDDSARQPDVPTAKRVKMENEIAGRS